MHLAALPLVGVASSGSFWPTRSWLAKDAEGKLDDARIGRDADLIDGVSLSDVHTVNTHRDGEPIHAPLVEVDLLTPEEPPLDAAYRITAAIVRAIRPALLDVHVRQYDVVFAFGETSWTGPWGKQERRIAVTPALVERIDREPDFDVTDLRAAIEGADDGDDEIPPVAWGESLGYQYYHDHDDWDSWGWAFFGT